MMNVAEIPIKMSVLIVRILLILNALLSGKLGYMYYNTVSVGSSTETLSVLANLLHPGLLDQGEVVAQILYPFMGVSYFAVTAINLLAGVTFGPFEASGVLLVDGIVLHIANSIMRLRFPERVKKHYRRDIILSHTLPEPPPMLNPRTSFNHVGYLPPFITLPFIRPVTHRVGT